MLTILLQTQWIKTHTYFLTVCEEISHSLTGSCARLQSRGWPGLCSPLKTVLGKGLLPGSHGCWPHSVPCRKSDWAPQFFAGTPSSLPRGPLHRLAHNIACFIQPARKCKMAVTILYTIILKATCCHHCRVVLEASYQSFPHTGWGDLYVVVTTRMQGLLGDILQSIPPLPPPPNKKPHTVRKTFLRITILKRKFKFRGLFFSV